MYLWPRADVMGYRPGKSIAMVCFIAVVSTMERLIRCIFFVLITFASALESTMAGSLGGFVDLIPCLILLKCPSTVYGDSCKWASTRGTVRPGQDTYALLLMASLKVDNGGKPAVA
mgnify:CR=1 FL=1